ncbi:MAG TPA: alpha/beta hydrolase-fold protein, partial [Gemmatimonadaceae bacterium]|nr:alpha/beta hydrolase-fold protein [Gemmatimonadaceae bacterium]
REYGGWTSPALGRSMEYLIFGHSGARVLVFPSSNGRFYEWEDFKMIDSVRDHLERGWVQLFCVDSVDAESWYNSAAPPPVRAHRHGQYDQYLANEFLPFTSSRNHNPMLIVTGASFGAYQAMAFGLRHPEMVGRIIGMSGLYDVRRFTDGFTNDDVYYANPFEFIQNETDDSRLAAMRRMDIILATGRDDPSVANSVEMSRRLWEKGIGNALRLWDGWAHDWPYWQQMVRTYIGGHD